MAELEAALEIALDLEFLSKVAYDESELKRKEVGFLLTRLISSLKKK